MSAREDGPHVLPLESGVWRPVLVLWAERTPAGWGFVVAALLIVTALYGQHKALWGLLLVAAWQGIWIAAARRDPMYGAVMARAWWWRPIPVRLQAWPRVGAAPVPIEASVPVRGDGGVVGRIGGGSRTGERRSVSEAPAAQQQPAQPMAHRPPSQVHDAAKERFNLEADALLYSQYRWDQRAGVLPLGPGPGDGNE